MSRQSLQIYLIYKLFYQAKVNSLVCFIVLSSVGLEGYRAFAEMTFQIGEILTIFLFFVSKSSWIKVWSDGGSSLLCFVTSSTIAVLSSCVSLVLSPELLFPVCNPKPQRGESCLNHPNLLMDMLAWDQEGPRDHCQCADHLQCRAHG